MSTITIPTGFGYVGAALLGNIFLLLGQTLMVGRFRDRAGIKYPQLYAEKAEAEQSKDAFLFNCAQRAHQNTLESLPIVLILTLLGGLQYPVVVAAASGAWTISRISYSRGYVTGDPIQRTRGLSKLAYVGQLALLGSSVLTVVNLIQADL
ncbi:membrane-associated proteins in eicosanoid and glutathione metabolism [Pluteus cervinus]|uniref:Membrane-associated proteins in eicosanoid and glutathione metabolism n=1 Tax=Pluteus cervinus TaxID=181527 RepID=A0ACD3BJD4_9AGAR|nr:membrane-associated proteins in eicosanoid and glutathione metabolism [Pluteus cervinus]